MLHILDVALETYFVAFYADGGSYMLHIPFERQLTLSMENLVSPHFLHIQHCELYSYRTD